MRVTSLFFQNALPWILSLGLAFFAAMSVVATTSESLGMRIVLAVPMAVLLSGLSSSLRFVLRGETQARGRQRFSLFLLVGGGLASSLCSGAVLHLSATTLLHSHEASRLFLPAAVAGLAVYSAHFGYFYAGLAERMLRESELESLGRELRERDMELALLTAKFSPHFLFNALNSVAALTRKDPGKAYEMCVTLGDYLRESLRNHHGRLSTLGAEIRLVRDYLALERMRYGDRIELREEIAELGGEPFPGLVLQLLAENAVKHGVATMAEPCALLLRCHADEDHVEVVLENEFGDGKDRASSQLGLGLAKAQIAHYSAGSATFSTEKSATRFRVMIRWPRGAMERGL